MVSQVTFATAAASNRAESEDRAHVFEHAGAVVVVVADGAGGLRGGATASDAIVAAVRTRIASSAFDPYDVRAWSEALKSTDAGLARPLAGETTAIVAVVGADGIVGVSVGDSEAWIVSGDGVDRLTEVQVRSRIGSGRARPVAFHRRALTGTLVVATDGLFKYARSESISSACAGGSAAEIAERVLVLPRLPSGGYPDDVALAVVTTPKGIVA